jgi:thioredoxin reductase (NADPH)
MNSPFIYDVAVIGAGAAGMQATLRAVLNNDATLLFTGDARSRKRSREFWVRKVENMPGLFQLNRAIVDTNVEVLQWIEQSALKHKLTLKKNKTVTHIEKSQELFILTDGVGEKYCARFVILCTGVMDVQPKILGSIAPVLPYANMQIVDYCLRCDGHHVLGKNTAVIGNDSSAVWVAIMLHERYQPPSMTVLFHGARVELNDELKHLVEKYKIKIDHEEMIELIGDAKAGLLTSIKTAHQNIACEIAFVSLGMIVYNDLAKMLGAQLDARGFVIADDNGMSSIDGLYVAGDVRANTKKQIYTAWDNATTAADAINARLRKMKRG